MPGHGQDLALEDTRDLAKGVPAVQGGIGHYGRVERAGATARRLMGRSATQRWEPEQLEQATLRAQLE